MQFPKVNVNLKIPFVTRPPKPTIAEEAFSLGESEEMVDGRVPRTQSLIEIAGARDNCLILRDTTVVAAIGFTSMDDTLLTDDDIALKQELYYDLLVTLRFPVQFLITTRPQDMSPYFTELLEQRDRHDVMRHMVELFARRLPDYVRSSKASGETGFVKYFGWHPNDLIGTPGKAHDVAWKLCDVSDLTLLRGKGEPPHKAGQTEAEQFVAKQVALAEQAKDIEKLCDAIRSSSGWLTRWRRILSEQIETVHASIRKAQSPVRRYYMVVSHSPRLKTSLLTGKAISDQEFTRAGNRLAEYCRQMAAGIDAMGLPVWRASHDELLLDVRTFFNPSQALLAGRKQRLLEQGEPVDQDD